MDAATFVPPLVVGMWSIKRWFVQSVTFFIQILQRSLFMPFLAALPGLRSILNDGRGLRLADVIAGIITGLVLVPAYSGERVYPCMTRPRSGLRAFQVYTSLGLSSAFALRGVVFLRSDSPVSVKR